MELVDTHCHLTFDPLASRLEEVLRGARTAGVTRVVAPAFDVDSWSALAKTRESPGVAVALGLHPWVAGEPLEIERLEERIVATGAVAVGEVGLDFALPDADQRQQTRVLSAQLRLARRLDLPVILHCRKAFDALLELLRDHGPVRGVLHAFSRGPELARQLEKLDLHLAFGGAVTRPRARRPRRSAQVVSANRLLLETDAPSIGLEGVPPEQTEPQHVAQVAEAVAELRGENVETIAELTTKNARSLFALP